MCWCNHDRTWAVMKEFSTMTIDISVEQGLTACQKPDHTLQRLGGWQSDVRLMEIPQTMKGWPGMTMWWQLEWWSLISYLTHKMHPKFNQWHYAKTHKIALLLLRILWIHYSCLECSPSFLYLGKCTILGKTAPHGRGGKYLTTK